MERPFHNELYNKLREAGIAVSKGLISLLNQDIIAADAIELEYTIGTELIPVLKELLDYTTPGDYAGYMPPQKSYEREIKGLDLFPFVVDCHRLKCRIYYKFALIEGRLWLVSLHQDRRIKEES
ncbi:MAG: hypothetical protein U9R17_05535 [Thermodesulfobacteriota bacterium]|nr:hypothetical protein [Thermodesulfobacteriota bacterium]